MDDTKLFEHRQYSKHATEGCGHSFPDSCKKDQLKDSVLVYIEICLYCRFMFPMIEYLQKQNQYHYYYHPVKKCSFEKIRMKIIFVHVHLNIMYNIKEINLVFKSPQCVA